MFERILPFLKLKGSASNKYIEWYTIFILNEWIQLVYTKEISFRIEFWLWHILSHFPPILHFVLDIWSPPTLIIFHTTDNRSIVIWYFLNYTWVLHSVVLDCYKIIYFQFFLIQNRKLRFRRCVFSLAQNILSKHFNWPKHYYIK